MNPFAERRVKLAQAEADRLRETCAALEKQKAELELKLEAEQVGGIYEFESDILIACQRQFLEPPLSPNVCLIKKAKYIAIE